MAAWPTGRPHVEPVAARCRIVPHHAGTAPTPPWPGGPKSGRRRPACYSLCGVTLPVCTASRSVSASAHDNTYPQGGPPAGPGALRAPLKT
jgi:hypothetical protein